MDMSIHCNTRNIYCTAHVQADIFIRIDRALCNVVKAVCREKGRATSMCGYHYLNVVFASAIDSFLIAL